MESRQDLVLVTGVTGKQGGAVARELLAMGVRVRGMTRRPESDATRGMKKLGVEIVAGDFDDEASVRRALAGAWGAFSVQNTWDGGVEREELHGKRFAQLARQAGIQHLVYSSVGSAHRQTNIPHFENKWRIEQAIRDLGFPTHVVLRPVFFMENFTSPSFLSAIQRGQLALAVEPTTVIQMIAVQDIGKYGAWAFDKHRELNGRGLDIAGDQLSMVETAKLISAAVEHPVEFVRVPIEQVRAFSADVAVMHEWFDGTGFDADIAAMSRESGVRPTPFKNWAARAAWKTPVTTS